VFLKVAVLPGDGIGPEVTRQAVRMLRVAAEASGVDVRLTEWPIGGAALAAGEPPLPAATLEACLASDAVLLGAVGDPRYDGWEPRQRPEAGLLALRRALGGFANLRPCACDDALVGCSVLTSARARGVDLLIVRELLGGLYYGEPRGVDADGSAAMNTMRYTRDEVARVAHLAFAEARQRRHRVTSVDKANVLETSRLWRTVVSDVGRAYPDVSLDHQYVDAFAMQMLLRPGDLDVVLTGNLFGDILSDEAAAIAGSLGLLPSASLGGRVALYEPVHGSAPTLAGTGRANPIGAIACVALLLRHTAGLPDAAAAVEQAVHAALGAGCRTADLVSGSEAAIGTVQMADAIEVALSEALDHRRAYHAV
jgi:3-isopropylmalate dehydrogenase